MGGLGVKHSALYGATVCVLTALAVAGGGHAVGEETYLSPLALAVYGDTVYISEFTANQIAVFDAGKNRVKKTIELAAQSASCV